MEPLSYDLFLEWFPEFSGVPVGAATRQLHVSNTMLPQNLWRSWWNQAAGLFTAHYLALRFDISQALLDNGIKSPTASIGTVTNKSANTSGLSEGSVVSGLVTSDNPFEADFGRTTYGLEFLSLVNMVIPPGAVVYSPSASVHLAHTSIRRPGT